VEESKITLNYGVYCGIVADAMAERIKAPTVWDTHWRERLSHAGRERWIVVAESTSVSECAMEFSSAIEEVLPDLLKHGSNEVLRDVWLSGRSPGLVDVRRLLYLTLLMKELGPRERLGEVIHDLRVVAARTGALGQIERRLVDAGLASSA
jgi:hypothetical protein